MMKKLFSLLRKLSGNHSVLALQEACISLLPLVISMTMILLLGHCFKLLPSTWITHEWAASIFQLLEFFYLTFPLLFTVSLSISLAKSNNMEPVIVIVLSVSLLLIAAFSVADSLAQLRTSIYYKVLPIPICYMTVRLFGYLITNKRFLVYKEGEFGIGLRHNMNAIIPSIITFAVVFGVLLMLRFIDDTLAISTQLNAIQTEDINSPLSVVVSELVFKLTWFVGVNPNHIYQFLDDPFYMALVQNHEAFTQGLPIPNIVVEGFHIYSDIGGSGGILCLMAAIFYISKSQHKRNIAKLSAIPSAFNISEVMHYGLPILFNPFLLIPFLLVPILLSLWAYFVIWAGWVSPIVEIVPWITPPFVNAYLSTGGDVAAVLLQVFNFIIGTLIYIEFIKVSEKAPLSERVVDRLSNKLQLYSKNIQALQYRNQKTELKSIKIERQISKTFREISQGELLLYYQPIICLRSKKIIKLEALMRLRTPEGIVKGPFFIETLSKAGLAADFDQWVVERVAEQSAKWSSMTDVGISINVSPKTLLDAGFIEYLITHRQHMQHPLTIEVLENEIIFEESTINAHLQRLRQHDIEVYLDDFGSGYSALSLLSKLSVDGVKFYGEFSEQLKTQRGYELLEASMSISRALQHKTVLEGIETHRQLEAAIELGLDYVQGYVITRPIHPNQVLDFIKAFNHAPDHYLLSTERASPG
ncbi:EAL domain-containing protein [Marinicella sp. W31]|uniref:EAL domain-containing protein n=1 Tax=Marinicella sp. W31 TaxID=3023713 RepID=UPI003756788B